MGLFNDYSHQTIPGMNSVLDILLIGVAEKESEAIGKQAEKELLVLESLLSRFNPSSETFALNKKAVNGWTNVSQELWNVLIECEKYRHLTLGYFNVGLGHLKADAVLSEGWHQPEIILGMDTRRFRFGNTSTSIDFGAIGKGLVLRKLKSILADFQVKNCFVSFGGSSLMAIGSHPAGRFWPVSLRENDENPIVFELTNQTVSISGAYQSQTEKFHVVHPYSGAIQCDNRLVYVQDDCPVRAEVLSTACIVAERQDYLSFIENLNPQKLIVFQRTQTNKLTIDYDYSRSVR